MAVTLLDILLLSKRSLVMSNLSFKPAILLCPLFLSVSSFSQANPISNDLLRYEQWGLNNTVRTVATSPSNIDPQNVSSTGTCAEKPDIVSNTYTCGSYTEAGVEDMDINAIEPKSINVCFVYINN